MGWRTRVRGTSIGRVSSRGLEGGWRGVHGREFEFKADEFFVKFIKGNRGITSVNRINNRFVVRIETIKNIGIDVLGIKGGSKKSKFIDYTPKLLHIIVNRGGAFFLDF